MGNRFGKQNPPITAGCDLTAMGSLLADNKGTLFPSAPRFPKQNSTINTRKSGSQVSAADVSLVDATDNNKNAGFTFSRDQRSKDNTINDAPSPTRYNVSSYSIQEAFVGLLCCHSFSNTLCSKGSSLI